MIEINLIPDVKREHLRTRMVRNLVISVSIIVGIGVIAVVAVLGLVFGGQIAAEALQDREIKEKGEQLTSIEDLNETVTIQQQLGKIDEQHQNKKINSRMFDVLSAINPPAPNDIKISTFKLDPIEKTIFIEGSATNGYAALEVFKKTIISTKIQIKGEDSEEPIQLAQDIVDGEASFGENADGQKVLRFSFSFTYPDELFAVLDSSVSVITPSGKVDVTDSKVGVPDSLFSARAKDMSSERER